MTASCLGCGELLDRVTEQAASRAQGRFPPLADLPWHAVLIPGAAVLNAWVNARIYPAAMGRTLAFALLLGLLLTAVFALVTRRLIAGGLLASAVAVVLLSWTPVQIALIASSIMARMADGNPGRVAARTLRHRDLDRGTRQPW